MSPLAFIIVHGGAGVHGHKDEGEVKRALRTACSEALKTLSQSTGISTDDFSSTSSTSSATVQPAPLSLQIVERAIQSLEDDDHLNAGYGSNLTIEGTVECDASIMHAHVGNSSRSNFALFGSVGAMSGIRNPISAARAVLEHSKKKDGIGRVPPLTLVSSGAYNFASSRGVATVPPEALVTASAKEKWKNWKDRFESSQSESASVKEPLMDLQDTVGAVAFHEADGVTAGVSSGGLLLKYPGRIGEAAAYGAGCWACISPRTGIACSVSGTGEHIIRSTLARRIGEALAPTPSDKGRDPHIVLERLLREFWELGRIGGDRTPSVGVIVLTTEGDTEPRVRLWCAFTTESMAIGHASTRSLKPKAMILRRPQGSEIQDEGGEKPQIYITSWLL